MGGLVSLDIKGIADDVLSGIEHYLPSSDDQAQAALVRDQARAAIIEKITAPITQANAAQLAISKKEAATGSLYLDGWHAAIGWAGAAALIFNAMGQPLLSAMGLPVKLGDTADLLNILQYMLGLGGMGIVHQSVKAYLGRKNG